MSADGTSLSDIIKIIFRAKNPLNIQPYSAPLTELVAQLESLGISNDDIDSLSERELAWLIGFLNHPDHCRMKETLKRIPSQEIFEYLQIYIYDEHNKIIVHDPRFGYESLEFLADLHDVISNLDRSILDDLKQTIKSLKLKGDYDNVRELIILQEELRILRDAKLIRKI